MEHTTRALADTVAALETMVAAGLVEAYVIDPDADLCEVTFTPAIELLLRAGHLPLADPEFAALWALGDLAGLRSWVRRTADALGR